MKAIVFGTAGHIDHGKTSLVAALTGVNCDRLPEEKRRGITLVLGFAPLSDPMGEMELSFVDVPGHERLVHTMIAGAGGIDRALLVVAADEGVMPQTREHLAVLRLLGIRGGVVGLNKADLLEDELLELRIEEVREALGTSLMAGAPVIPCSAATGQGVEELRAAVLACARDVVREVEPDRPFRLAVDRVFTVVGAGTVVTGTARWGRVRVGDELVALPSGRQVRVRGIQVHGTARQEAGVAERVALSLAGTSVQDLPRGEQLLSSGAWPLTRRLTVDVELLGDSPPLDDGGRVWVHVLASRVSGRVERASPAPLCGGSRGRATVRLASPVFTVPGDRVILRRLSPAQTLGGGIVLETHPPHLRRRERTQLDLLPPPGHDFGLLLHRWVAEAGPGGVSTAVLAARLGLLETGIQASLGQLHAAGRVVVLRSQPPVLLVPEVLEEARRRARAVLAEAGGVGLPLAELLARAIPEVSERLRPFYLEDLRRAGVLREAAGRAMSADRAPVEDALMAKVEALYERAGADAPSPAEAAVTLQANPKIVEGLVRYLVDAGRLARVGGKWVLHRGYLDGIVAELRSSGLALLDVGQFKDRFGLTRKLAIPILEWLDTQRVTRREGERRRVLSPPGTRSGG